MSVTVSPINTDVYVNFSKTNFGFGQVSVSLNDDGTYDVGDEFMGREITREILHAWVEDVISRGVFDRDRYAMRAATDNSPE